MSFYAHIYVNLYWYYCYFFHKHFQLLLQHNNFIKWIISIFQKLRTLPSYIIPKVDGCNESIFFSANPNDTYFYHSHHYSLTYGNIFYIDCCFTFTLCDRIFHNWVSANFIFQKYLTRLKSLHCIEKMDSYSFCTVDYNVQSITTSIRRTIY